MHFKTRQWVVGFRGLSFAKLSRQFNCLLAASEVFSKGGGPCDCCLQFWPVRKMLWVMQVKQTALPAITDVKQLYIELQLIV